MCISIPYHSTVLQVMATQSMLIKTKTLAKYLPFVKLDFKETNEKIVQRDRKVLIMENDKSKIDRSFENDNLCENIIKNVISKATGNDAGRLEESPDDTSDSPEESDEDESGEFYVPQDNGSEDEGGEENEEEEEEEKEEEEEEKEEEEEEKEEEEEENEEEEEEEEEVDEEEEQDAERSGNAGLLKNVDDSSDSE